MSCRALKFMKCIPAFVHIEMRPTCRYLTFSLRTLFVLLTIGCVWLGWKCEQARTQREAVKAIEALGGTVYYDWQLQYLPNGQKIVKPGGKPNVPDWIRKIIGDDVFQTARVVAFGDPGRPVPDVLNAIPHLQRLRELETVGIPYFPPTLDEVRAALPKCKIHQY